MELWSKTLGVPGLCMGFGRYQTAENQQKCTSKTKQHNSLPPKLTFGTTMQQKFKRF
jgi:hypothetical protein